MFKYAKKNSFFEDINKYIKGKGLLNYLLEKNIKLTRFEWDCIQSKHGIFSGFCSPSIFLLHKATFQSEVPIATD